MLHFSDAPPQTTLAEYLLPIAQVLDRTPLAGDGLFMGNLGKVLYYAYLSRHTDNPGYGSRANQLLDDIFGRVLDGSSTLWRRNCLISGMAGLGWAITALWEDQLLDDDFSGFLAKVEKQIAAEVPAMIADNDLDYVQSSAGVLAYLIERTTRNPALVPQVEACIAAIQEKLEAHPAGGAYVKNQYTLKISKLVGATDPSDVKLRLAHGLSGILLVLLKAYERGIAPPAARHVVEQGVAFLLTTLREEHLADPRRYAFPSNVFLALPPDHPRNLSFYHQRLAWCYGDLNQVLVLYRAGKCLGHPGWIEIADRVGLATLRKKSYQETSVEDASLCHGTAGLARIYQSLYQLSGRTPYLAGYDYWNERTAGYLAEIFAHDRLPDKPASLLEGLPGAGLSLLAHLRGQPASWEKIFLLY